MRIKVAIYGAGGRMGRMLCELADKADDLELSSAIDYDGNQNIGNSIAQLYSLESSDLKLTALADKVDADVVVDFSLPEGTARLLKVLQKNPLPLICGTTGLTDELKAELDRLATKVPVVFAPNFSTGVNLLFELAERATEIMGDDVDIEIMEIHHRHKKDAPSGTAVGLLEGISKKGGYDIETDTIYGREGLSGERPKKQLAVHALRGGEVVGEHTVYLFAKGERLELTHRAQSREAFASGALLAARWAVNKKEAGMFNMRDVLKRKNV